MWHVVKGCEIHDDHICLSVTPVQSSVQVTNHVMKELNQLGLARPSTTEAVLAVSKKMIYRLHILQKVTLSTSSC